MDVIECADSETRRDRDVAELIRERFGRRGVGKDDGELVTAEPRDPVSPETQPVTDAMAELPQYLISNLMPMLVVDALEVIDVGHQDGQWPAQAGGPLDFARKLLLEVVPACGTRDLVKSRQQV